MAWGPRRDTRKTSSTGKRLSIDISRTIGMARIRIACPVAPFV